MRIVNVRHERCTHYCGRGFAPSGVAMGLGNPVKLTSYDPRERRKAINAFEAYARATPAVMEKIAALPEDAVLGCWCKPHACHCDVIVKIWKETHGTRTKV